VVRREIEYFRPRLVSGGTIVVDDTETLPDELLLGWGRWKNMAWLQNV
jgi:hypothetical protein